MHAKTPLFILCMLFLLACAKHHTAPEGVPPSRDSITKPAPGDSATAIVVQSNYSYDETSFISVYEPDGRLRWKTTAPFLYISYNPPPVYTEGRLFLNKSTNIWAFDMKNGALLWQRRPGINTGAPVPYQGKLYANNSDGNIYEISPQNGAGKSKIFQQGYVGESSRIVISDSTVYATTATFTPFPYNSMTAIDMSTWTPKWTTGLGVSIGSVGLYYVARTGGCLVFGSDRGSAVQAVNMKTGAVQWTRTDIWSEGLIAAGNRVYAVASNVPRPIVAIDIQTGNDTWKWKNDTLRGEVRNMYLYEGKLHFTKYETGKKYYITLDAAGGHLTGNRQAVYDRLEEPQYFQSQLAGDKLYRVEGTPGPPYKKMVVVYQADNLTPVDSIPIPGNNVQNFLVIKKTDH